MQLGRFVRTIHVIRQLHSVVSFVCMCAIEQKKKQQRKLLLLDTYTSLQFHASGAEQRQIYMQSCK